MATEATATSRIPLMNLGLMHDEIAAEVAEGFARVIAATAFVGGPDVAAFESEFATYSGRASVSGPANGTDAIELGLRAAGIGVATRLSSRPTPSSATAEAVRRAGATPVVLRRHRRTPC